MFSCHPSNTYMSIRVPDSEAKCIPFEEHICTGVSETSVQLLGWGNPLHEADVVVWNYVVTDVTDIKFGIIRYLQKSVKFKYIEYMSVYVFIYVYTASQT